MEDARVNINKLFEPNTINLIEFLLKANTQIANSAK